MALIKRLFKDRSEVIILLGALPKATILLIGRNPQVLFT